MIEPDELKRIIEYIKLTDDWKDNVPQEDDTEFLHQYYCFEFLSVIVVVSEYYDHYSNESSYQIWEKGKLRRTTDVEDEIFRMAFNEGFRDNLGDDEHSLISRDENNHIYEGDSSFPSPKEET